VPEPAGIIYAIVAVVSAIVLRRRQGFIAASFNRSAQMFLAAAFTPYTHRDLLRVSC
jgi:hypothetical protein